MKRLFISTLTLVLVSTLLAVPYLLAQTKQLTFSTGAMGGGFYAIGGGMAAYINNIVKGVAVTAQTSGGVNENINRLDTGVADIALVSTWDAYQAYRGEGQFQKKYAGTGHPLQKLV
jgi:TRAP-type uncharacterized transport system substrate-binding protein